MAKKAKKEKKIKEPKVKKPKKKKEKNDGGGINVFFANHIEKLLFGLAGLLCLLLIHNGFNNRDGIEPNKTPAALDQQITTTTRKVDDYTWEHDFADILKKDDKEFPQRADQALKPLEADSYVTNQYLRPPISPPRTKRTDPDLLAAEALQVRSGYGVLRKQLMREGRSGGPIQEEEPDFGAAQPDVDEIGDGVRPLPNRFGGERSRNRRTDSGEGVYFVSITGLVPVRRQLEEYQNRLLNSRGHDPGRDAPTYVNWLLQRATVSKDGETGPFRRVAVYSKLKGKDRFVGREARFSMGQQGADNFDQVFSYPVLTTRVPNIEVRNPEELFIHDHIAELTIAEQEKKSQMRDRGSDDATTGDGEDGIWGDPQATTGPDGRERRFDGDFRPQDGGSFYDRGERPREGGSNFFRQGQIRGDTPLEDAPEYYMFRYVDTKVAPGQRYKYRLKLIIEDPNAPNDGNAPQPETMEASVADRLSRTKVPPNRTFFGRVGDYSAESPIVRVRPGQTVLAGEVRPASSLVVRDTGQLFSKPGADSVAKLLALKFDAKRAVDIPGEVVVRPGSVVDFRKEVEVPLYTLGVLKKEKHHFQFETVVLDIRGGDEAKLDFLSRPGEVLVWDESGGISVLNQLEDAELYASNTFPEEKRSTREERRVEGDDGRRREGARGEGGRREGRSRRREG